MGWSLVKRGCVLIIGSIFLAGCEYQDAPDPIDYKPGVYQGKPDQGLTKEQLEALKNRGKTAY